jgi:23S rRNA pseudouridine1911/1915/1917 synthase
MRMHENAIRRGEWLEISMQRELPVNSLEQWVCDHYNVPQKLLSKLKRENGIRLKSDRLMLHLFPQESDPYKADWIEIDVLYEDDFCLVVNKPAGMAVHPAFADQQDTLANAVAAHYIATGQFCRIRHIHRLDEMTSGAVLYAKNELAQIQLDEQMRKRTIHRQYAAFIEGVIHPPKGRIDAPIGKDRHHPNRRRVSPTGIAAITNYELIERLKDASLLRLLLETGRTHQIRVHLQSMRHPLLGDKLYGGNTRLISRQALHGESITFPHPFGQQLIAVIAPLPSDLIKLHEALRMEAD